MPPSAPDLHSGVDLYLEHLAAERGLSSHTLAAYGQDLASLCDYLAASGAQSWPRVSEVHLLAWLAAQGRAGASPRSRARRLSAARGLMRFLVAAGVLAVDPAANLAGPKLPGGLPRFLSPAEMERLLEAPDPKSDLGLRDRALLEVLYAAGLRVSELTGLGVGDIQRQVGVLSVTGKGSKQRLVPLNQTALERLEVYLAGPRGRLLKGRQAEQVFLNRRGRPLTRQGVFYLVRKHARSRLRYTLFTLYFWATRIPYLVRYVVSGQRAMVKALLLGMLHYYQGRMGHTLEVQDF